MTQLIQSGSNCLQRQGPAKNFYYNPEHPKSGPILITDVYSQVLQNEVNNPYILQLNWV